MQSFTKVFHFFLKSFRFLIDWNIHIIAFCYHWFASVDSEWWKCDHFCSFHRVVHGKMKWQSKRNDKSFSSKEKLTQITIFTSHLCVCCAFLSTFNTPNQHIQIHANALIWIYANDGEKKNKTYDRTTFTFSFFLKSSWNETRFEAAVYVSYIYTHSSSHDMLTLYYFVFVAQHFACWFNEIKRSIPWFWFIPKQLVKEHCNRAKLKKKENVKKAIPILNKRKRDSDWEGKT